MRRNGRAFSTALLSAGVCSALALGAGPAETAAASTAHRATGTAAPGKTASAAVPVVIFLKNQWQKAAGGTRSQQRAALIQAAQAPYVKRLEALGATDVLRYRLVNAIAAHVPAAALGSLSASPVVATVIPDSPVAGPSPAMPPARPTAVTRTVTKTQARACPAKPELAPEALSLTRADSMGKGARTARSLGYTGAGVQVAFLADGIDPHNPNLMRAGKPVISDYKDFSGEGTSAPTAGGAAFTDASAIAGQASTVYNVAGFSAQVPASACKLRIEGMAPGASLVALKVFSQAGVSTTSALLRAIDYAVSTDHVNVLDESFGTRPFPDPTSLDAVREFNDMAVAAGTTVVVPAGDAGPFAATGSAASDPAVISVGASTDFRFYAQTGYAGADKFAPHGWEDNNVSALSPGGYPQDGRTLDLVAPGDQSFASCTPVVTRYSSCVNFLGKPSPVEASAGTSAAAPVVAGAAALVIQAYARGHHGSLPTPAVVKQVLLSTAADLGAPATEQGAGLLNALRAVELAAWLPGRHPAGPTLKLSSNQLNDTGKPGSAASWPVTVTNAASTRQAVAVSGRGFSSGSVVKQASVTLSDAKSPRFTNWSGIVSNYGTVRFPVPRGAALLNASVTWPASAFPGSTTSSGNANARVLVILVDPAGKLAAGSLPQGASGYGRVQVLHPAAGTWTAVISSATARAGGVAGTVRFGASVSRAEPFGAVSPAKLVLAPGASGVVHVSARVPAGAGDSDGSLVFATGAAGAASSAAGGPVSVPVTLRGQVLARPGTAGTFSGVLTGGNGPSPGEGQVAAYAIAVPGSLSVPPRDLDVDLVLASDPASQVSAYLVAPGGQTMGYGSSYLTTGFTSGRVPVESPQRTLSVYASNPIPGTWTLLVDLTSPLPGNGPSDRYTGRVRLNAASFSRGGLPDSPSVKLNRGQALTYPITVHNSGAAPEDIFLDPRLTRLGTYLLQPQDQVADVKVPVPATVNPPEWIVPTLTRTVSVSASSSVPVMFDFGPFPGGQDEASASGTTARAAYPSGKALTPVTPGLWFAMPSEVRSLRPAGATGTTVTASMSAVTQQFDTSASPANGDFWRFSVAALASRASYNLFVVNPGQTRIINLTVKPGAHRGTVVHGLLCIDDFVDSMQFLSGSQLAAIPYAYTVK